MIATDGCAGQGEGGVAQLFLLSGPDLVMLWSRELLFFKSWRTGPLLHSYKHSFGLSSSVCFHLLVTKLNALAWPPHMKRQLLKIMIQSHIKIPCLSVFQSFFSVFRVRNYQHIIHWKYLIKKSHILDRNYTLLYTGSPLFPCPCTVCFAWQGFGSRSGFCERLPEAFLVSDTAQMDPPLAKAKPNSDGGQV